MNETLIQRTRYILRSRFRRVQTSPIELFSSSCLQLSKWIQNHPILSLMSAPLSIKYQTLKDKVEDILEKIREDVEYFDPGHHEATTLEEHSALCFFIVITVSKTIELKKGRQISLIRFLSEFITGSENNDSDSLEIVKDIAVDGLFEFFDEKIDDRNSIYGLLLKYKQISEWFDASNLRELAKHGEKGLVKHCQKYIMQQGVEFFIEPSSVSGEADLLLKGADGQLLIIDAKYISEDSASTSIIKKFSDGFHQVMKYCENFNEPIGYLITFNHSKKRISLEIDEIDGISYFSLGGKLIFSIIISIGSEPSASKLGKGQELIIKKSKLKEVVK